MQRCSTPPGQPRSQCCHSPQRCICCPKQINPASHSTHPHGEGVAEDAGRNQIYTAASYRPIPQDTQNPIGPFAPAARQPPQLRFASLTQHSRVGRLTSSSPIRAPSPPAGVASFASRVSFLPPRCLLGQSARQPVDFCPSSEPRSPFPFARPAPVPSRWPIVSPPPSHQLCYRGHSHPGSDKHACPPREPTAVGQACFMFAGAAPMGWRMSPSCFAGPAAHPRDDIIDPDTRCLFRAFIPPKATNLCPQLLPRLRAGLTANKLHHVPHCGTRSVVAWPRNVLPPPPPHHQSSSAPSLVHPPPPRGAGYYAGPQPCAPPERWFGSRTCPSIGRNQPSRAPGSLLPLLLSRCCGFRT